MKRPICILLALCVYTLDARAQDAGVPDVPAAVHVPQGSTIKTPEGYVYAAPDGYFFPKRTYVKMDDEVKRLQRVERIHNDEGGPWLQVLLALVIGAGVGAGVAVAVQSR